MSNNQGEGYAGKHPQAALDATVAESLRQEIKNGRISCAAAHRVARNLERPPAEIGVALDLMEVRLMRCQLGLFGYSPEKSIAKAAGEWDPALEKDIRDALQEGRLSCAAAWAIAHRHGMSRLGVANVCEALAIKVRPCQLGAF